MRAGEENNLSSALMDRLFLDKSRVDGMAKSLEEIASLKDPVGRVLDGWITDDELKIAELKEEALGYKAKLDEATDELKGFKNISNPVDDLQEALNMAKGGFKSTPLEVDEPIATQIEPKQEEVILKKKKSSDKPKESIEKKGNI
jgi:hypothetical protein